MLGVGETIFCRSGVSSHIQPFNMPVPRNHRCETCLRLLTRACCLLDSPANLQAKSERLKLLIENLPTIELQVPLLDSASVEDDYLPSIPSTIWINGPIIARSDEQLV